MSSKLTHKIWDYKSSGVDIKAGNDLVERIKPIAARTHRAEVMAGLGGFASLFALPKGYQNPVLVSGTDGVGTKLKLATQLGIHNTIGIDLVAMCVNDIVVFGAAPLFFLDYYASGKLDVAVAASVVEGIGYGCELAGAALIGGETAEMPGMYSNGDYDLAGFCVGIVEKDRIIDGSRVAAGDKLIALAASGAHSNGYSLIRKVLDQAPSRPTTEALLAPTKIYAKSLLKLLKTITPHAIAHITGGGLNENLPRVLPSGCDATVDLASWQLPDIFRWLMTCGNIAEDEMLSTFNCGVGMVLVVASGDLDAALAVLADAGESAFSIGEITSATGAAKVTYKGALQ